MEPPITFTGDYLRGLAVKLRDAATVVEDISNDPSMFTLATLGHQRILDLATPLGVQVQAFRDALHEAAVEVAHDQIRAGAGDWAGQERHVCTCTFASGGYLSKDCALHVAEGERINWNA